MKIENSHAQNIRRRVLRHILTNGGGYMSQACSSAEILSALYERILNIGPSEGDPLPKPFPGVPGQGRQRVTGSCYNGPKTPDLDRFVFSPVHYALVLYATLIEFGRMDSKGLELFNVDGSSVEMIGAEHSPGHEVTAGSLAQAISQAMGLALARKLKGDTGRVVVFMSDGEYEEGQTYEALAAAAFHKLGNLLVFVDANGFQCDGIMTGVGCVEPMKARVEAFGCTADEVDGHDIDAICRATAHTSPDKPHVVICRTDPCRGLEKLRERWPRLHYLRFKTPEEREGYEKICQEWEKA